MLIEGSDYFIKLVDFPTCACGGAITPNDDGTFTILINARLSREQNMDSCKHELNHIANGDFWRAADITDIERDAG